jgi:hypothetical protein
LIRGFKDEEPRIVHQRWTHDLPAHILGRIVFNKEEATGLRYYIKDHKTNKWHSVEFLKVEEEDNWYLLEKGEKFWFTYASYKVAREEDGTGWWKITTLSTLTT